MLLGQVLENLADETFAAEALLTLGDLPLLVQLDATARRFGESASAYAAAATRRFVDHASDEEWLALMNALERAADPGAACLRRMLAWSLRQDASTSDCGDARFPQENEG